MPTLAVQLTIGDYAKWRSMFDKAAHLRDKAGQKNVQVYRNADTPNSVLVWSEAQDLAKAREAISGPDIQKAMQEAGVVGPPKVHVIP
jgi:erythromycin esterase-like protein